MLIFKGMSKIIFLDVDGTLINYEAICPKSAKQAVKLARENGHKVYLCTGCSKGELLKRDLPEVDGIIGANGGYVESDGEVIMHVSLTKQDTKEIVDWCNNKELGFFLETNSGMYCNKYMLTKGKEALKKYVLGKGKDEAHAIQKAEELIKDYILLDDKDLYRDDVNKISFALSSYEDHLKSKETFKTLVANTWGGKGEFALFGDLSPKGILKKNAIEVLLKHLNVNSKDTIAFGDAKIDLSMFELCNFNVAMGNGGIEIKEAADYITDDVDNDGLYNAFKYLELI